MSQILFGPKKPHIYGTCGQFTESGYDKNASVILKYSNGRISSFFSHFKVKLSNEAVVFGTKGNIKVRYTIAAHIFTKVFKKCIYLISYIIHFGLLLK